MMEANYRGCCDTLFQMRKGEVGMMSSKEKTGKMLSVLEAAAALFIIVSVKVIVPVCPGMLELVSRKQVHMKCYYAGAAFVLFAVLLLVNAIVGFAAKQQLACGIMTIALAVSLFVTFSDSVGIGICANPEMACQMTAPFVKTAAAVELILGVIAVFVTIKKGADER